MEHEMKMEERAAGLKEPYVAPLLTRHAPLLEVPSKKALVAAAQMNVIEFHTWNARVRRIERPDRVIFDLAMEPMMAEGSP